MFRFVIALSMIFPVGSALAQPKDPGVGGHRTPGAEPTQKAPTGDDAVVLYPTRKGAGLVAFQKGYEAARMHDTDRSIDLFLEALKREPSLVMALYNLGVECSVSERWNDARQFYEAYRQLPKVDSKTVEAEIRRVTEVSRLDTNRRAFLKDFQPLVDEKNIDLAIAKLGSLSKQYSKQWEAPALLGGNLARAGRFPESIDALREAARRAPIELRSKLNGAADLAQKEVDFATRVNNADEARQNAQYETAAKMYSDAWSFNPARADLMMNAATAHLMADNVEAAVLSLDQARIGTDPEISAKAVRMLKALEEINPDVRSLDSGGASSGSAPPVRKTTPEFIAEQIGSLKTDEMILASQQPPPLLEEKSDVFAVPQDLMANGKGTVPEFKSTDSIFEIYQRNREAESKQQAALAASTPPPTVAADVEPSNPEPRRVQQAVVAPAVRSNSGPLQQVSITTVPTGATVHLDESGQDGPPQQCVSPCPFSLAVGSRHTLLVTHKGYRDARKIIDSVPRSGQTIPFTLEEAKGCLLLRESPGIVRIDGARQQTPSQVCISAGEHDISLELDGRTYPQKVVVEDQKTKEIKLVGQQN